MDAMMEAEAWRARAMRAEGYCLWLLLVCVLTAGALFVMGWWIERGGA